MVNTSFDDANDVVRLLSRIARNSDSGGEIQAASEKLDQSARWASWAMQVGIRLKSITGPGSPHYH
eukprot:9498449-Pyramimonas_sp.AAC.1